MAEKISEIGCRIINFFQRKRTEYVFQNAGPGFRLDESPSTSNESPKDSAEELDPKRIAPSEATKQAALARLTANSSKNDNPKTEAKKRNENRFEKVRDPIQTEDKTGISNHLNLNQDDLTESPTTSSKPQSSGLDGTRPTILQKAADAALARFSSNKKIGLSPLTSAQAHVKRELKKNRNIEKSIENELEPAEIIRNLAVNGVYFKCPLVSDEILSKDEWKPKIEDFLYAALAEDGGISACLLLFSCNYNVAKIQECVNVLCKYIDNIIDNPSEPKYHKIRCTNSAFKERVLPMVGATEILNAAGFRPQKMEHNGNVEDFWVWTMENIEGIEALQILKDRLKSGMKVELILDRNIQVLKPVDVERRMLLPFDFQGTMPESKVGMKYSLIRVLFPDEVVLQGVFLAEEKLMDVIAFVRENLELDLPFFLSPCTEFIYDETLFGSTLAELAIVPYEILTFMWDPSIIEEVTESGYQNFLKSETLKLMQDS